MRATEHFSLTKRLMHLVKPLNQILPVRLIMLATGVALTACGGVVTPANEQVEDAFFADDNFNLETAEVDITEENPFTFDSELLPTDFLATQEPESVSQLPDLQQRTFFFDFNSDIVRPPSYAALDSHATNIRQSLLASPNLVVVLEGHTDEVGTRGYNLSLGQRRAESVGRYLRVRGVPKSVIRIVSFGEEAPLVDGHDEAAWSQNRRVEIKY